MSSPTVSPSPLTPENHGPEFDFLTWFEVNKRTISTVVAAVVAAVIAYMIVSWRRGQSETAASRALHAATATEAAINSQALLQVAAGHAGTHAAERARLLAAGQLFAEGKYAEAQSEFAKFSADFAASPLVPTAALGVASALDAQNKTTEAIAAYQTVISSYGTDAVAGQARVAKARLLEAANQPAQALALYDEALRDSASLSRERVVLSRARLLQQHPELDKPLTTNAVAAPAK
jgi:tetratricopeptide (TPR) repeat protein